MTKAVYAETSSKNRIRSHSVDLFADLETQICVCVFHCPWLLAVQRYDTAGLYRSWCDTVKKFELNKFLVLSAYSISKTVTRTNKSHYWPLYYKTEW